MKKAKIYKPSKTAMQSGTKKYDKWIIEHVTENPGINPLMGWESSTDTLTELKLEFSTKQLAIKYAKKNINQILAIKAPNRIKKIIYTLYQKI